MEPYRINYYKCKLVREKSMTLPLDRITNSSDVYDLAIDKLHLDEADVESCYVLSLNVKGDIVGIHFISTGDLSSSIISPAKVMRHLILDGVAAGFILVHNHPSGDPTPSSEDLAVTKRLDDAGKLLGIKLVDHVIVGYGRHTSLTAEGLI